VSDPIAPPLATASALASASARAGELRRLAAQVEALRLLDLHRWAGDETWIGPVAWQCREQLLAHRRLLLFAADGLRAAARRVEQGALGP